MSMDNVLRELAQISRIVEKWNEVSFVSEIEKDILLGKLRALYVDVKALECGEEKNEIISSSEALISESDNDSQPIEREVEQGFAEKANETSNVELSEEAEKPVDQEAAAHVADETHVDDVADAFIAEEFVESNASSEEKAKKRKAIMSLYADSEETSQAQSEPVEETQINRSVFIQHDVVVEQTVEEHRKEVHIAKESHTVVIGDVLAANERTIADAYGDNGTADLASKISASNIRELRTAIGLNDKFLMIRDLFDGDAEAYSDAITQLDNYDSLDDALLFIHENYEWNPNSEGAVLLMDLLSRKLS